MERTERAGRVTRTGFVWGSAIVTRLFDDNGAVTIGIATTLGWKLEIRITATGRIRVGSPVRLTKKDREYYTMRIKGIGDYADD